MKDFENIDSLGETQYQGTKKKLKILGTILTLVGILITILGIVFSIMGIVNIGNDLFLLGPIGLGIDFIGIATLSF